MKALDLIRALQATGVDDAAIGKALIALEEAGNEHRRKVDAERQRKYRASRLSRVTTDSVRDTAPIIEHAHAQAGAPADDSSSSSVDTGKKNKKDIKRSAPVETWTPPGELLDFAKRLGFSSSLYSRELDKLRDWARAKGEVKKDWTAAARNWLRTAATNQNLLPLEPLETAGTVEVFRTDGRWEFLAARYERENGRNLRHAQKWPFPQGWLEGNGSLAERQTG